MMKQIVKKLLERTGFEIRRKDTVETLCQTDPLFNPLYEKAQRHTQMTATDNRLRRERHYVLTQLLQRVALSRGDVCEAGCWRGLSAYQIASIIRMISPSPGPVFHIFDSFQGLSEIGAHDRYERDRRPVEQVRQQFSCPIEQVKRNLQEFPFIEYHPGWIPDRFADVEERRFSFVHIDVDLYQPIRDSFDFFYPRLITGGIMVFDDYGCVQFPGAKKAVDEALEGRDGDFFLSLASGQAFLIKR